jgi:hypothetical protein
MLRARHRLFKGLIAVSLGLAGAYSAPAQILSSNLVFTSVTPCRVIDTRIANNGTNGRLIHGVDQTFNVVGGQVNPNTFSGQGGVAAGCSIPGFDLSGNSHAQVQAVVLNFVAVGSAGGGDLLAWPSDQSATNASIINYANSANLGFLNIANAVILPVRQDSQGADITLKAQVSDTDVVADVLGFFSAGSATVFGAPGNVFLGGKDALFDKGFAGNPAGNTGQGNTAIGASALSSNTTAGNNTAVGDGSLGSATSGGFNTAVGVASLQANTTGTANTAVGYQALLVSQTATENTAVGTSALAQDSTGFGNVALGQGALGNVTTGNLNIAIGSSAGQNLAAGSFNIDIGNLPAADESHTMRLGDASQHQTFIAGIYGVGSSGGTEVFVNSSGQLGTSVSSLRFKEEVEEMGEASAGLMRLRPVTFRYKPAYDDGSRLLQYGLIAEEVAKVYPGLVQYDEAGQPLAVRYHFVNAMLLNEVQRLHAQAEAQQAEIAGQRARIERLEARLARLEAAGISPH